MGLTARVLNRLVSAFLTVLVALFGRVDWTAPGWLRFLSAKLRATGGWARSHKPAAAGLLAAAALIGAAGTSGYRWYQNRPRPVEFSVTVTAPGLTRTEEGAKPEPLSLEFEGSVAPLKAVHKTVTTGIELSPQAAGAWTWDDDRHLVFRPKADWPIGQAFAVRLARKGLVADNVRLSTYKLEFKTAGFSATIASAEFYQDPVDANVKKVVATVTFTHPVDTASFEKRVHMHLDSRSRDEAGQDVKWHVTYDKHKVNAHIHSDPIAVPQKDTPFLVTVDKGIQASRGGPATENPLGSKVTIPGLFNLLKIQSAKLSLVDNERYEPEQVLIIETSTGVRQEDLVKNLSVHLLPLYEPGNQEEAAAKRRHAWTDPAVIGPEVLKQSQALQLQPIASEKEYATLLSFRYKAEAGRYLHLSVRKGLKGFGGYVLGDSWDATELVPEFPAQLKILQEGAIVSLSGARRVSIYARDVPGVRYEVGRVRPDQLHHLVTQTSGGFASPSFATYGHFDEQNLAEFFTDTRALPKGQPGKPQYQGFDLSKYLDGGGGRRGLFFLKIESWDPETKSTTGKSDSRLVLVTDLGMIVKDAADGTHDVFVQSIHTGAPVGGAKIDVIGRNGLAVLSAATDGDGHARIPSLKDFARERQPVLYLVSRGNDSAFLPLSRSDRNLDLSRYDIGGVYDRGRPQGLTAYLFSDRGIYRPGDEIRVGMIVKPKDWSQSLAGVPLQVSVSDARGLVVMKETVRLDAVGFLELKHQTQETSPTGTWTVNAHVVKDGEAGALLGSTTVKVREFLPDRMKLSVHLSSENPEGWVAPASLKGLVTLKNLFGTPAAGRKVRAQLTLSSTLPSFSRYRDYRFHDPLKPGEPYSDTLPDGETSDGGEAEFDLDLKRFAAATYRLTFLAEAFEAEGGRSVAGERSVVVSPLPFLVGYRADGDLGYVPRGSKHQVELIALGPDGKRLEAKDLSLVLMERRYVSVLTRQENGTYRYESVHKDVEVARQAAKIPAAGLLHPLPTARPGEFLLLVRNAKDEDLSRVEFSVAGQANVTRSLERSAQLGLSLKKSDVAPGEEIEVQVKAPYAGAGLITIERDRVFAHKWFKSTTTQTVETIRLPEELEGNGYVSVTFLREAGSKEVFMSPLSYGVVPFSVSRARRTTKVTVQTPDLVKPGEAFRMKFSTDQPASIVLFAVDEGILQVGKHTAPDPLAYFFQKRALEVRTAQILDLVLPEHERLMAAAAPGGDGEAALNANLNPFKRRRDKPVAYWSGIVQAGPEEREVVYQVPDTFNGTLRVMAVAVSQEALGRFERTALVRGDFVISPNVPTFAAPGDEFDVSVSVANNVVGSGQKGQVSLELKTSKHLQVQGPASVKLAVAEGREGTATFRVRATQELGSGSLTFSASLKDRRGKLTTDMSVRPPAAYQSTFTAGHLRDGTIDVPVGEKLHPEYRVMRAGISHLPLGLAHGLMGYLEKFPHGCTEQVTSQAMPAVALGDRPEFGFSPETSRKAVSDVIAILRARQNDDGAFGMWAANPHIDRFSSIYALHLLVEAKERGFAVPKEMLKSGVAWLQSVAGDDGDNLPDERLRAYAIYVMTRTGMVTTSLAEALQKKLNANYAPQWKKDLAAGYLASTHRLLHQDRAASAILSELKLGQGAEADYLRYYDGLIRDAQLLYLMARHFPERASKLRPEELSALATPIFKGSYNTLSSAYAILALEAYGRAAAQGDGAMTATELLAPGGQRPLALPPGLLPRVDFSDQARAIRFASAGPFASYWLVAQSGFPIAPPKQELKQKLEVFREYTDDKGKPLSTVPLGGEIRVHVRMRSLTGGDLAHIAIVDLLPGGFEVVVQARAEDSAKPGGGDAPPSEERGEGDGEGGGEGGEGDHGGDGEGGGRHEESAASGGAFALPISVDGTTFSPTYGDVREDRVVLYGVVTKDLQEYVYVIKATNAGSYEIAPILGDSMYDRTVLARGTGGRITVVKDK